MKQRPGDRLFTAGRCHGAHVAVVAVQLLCRRDDVTELKVRDHGAVALTRKDVCGGKGKMKFHCTAGYISIKV